MTTPKAKLAGLALIAALCAGLMLGLTAPAWADFNAGGPGGRLGLLPSPTQLDMERITIYLAALGRIRNGTPIVPSLSATGRIHPGNAGL